MESLLQQTNRTLFQLQNEMSSLGRSHDKESASDLETTISQRIQEIYGNCKRLEDYVFKEPTHRKQSSKMKVDQVVYDVRHIEASFRNYVQKRKQQELEDRRREELLSTNFKTNAEQNDTKIAMDYSLDHHNRLQGADKNVSQMLYTGMNALDQMKNQRTSLKGVRKRMLDIGNSLGLSNTLMRMIDKRGTQDRWIVFGGIILTLIIIFLTVKYLT